MNIAFGIEVFYPQVNGVATATINLATNLIKLGHSVYFFVPKVEGFSENSIENGINIIRIRALKTVMNDIKFVPSHANHLKPALKKYKIDLVDLTAPGPICKSLAKAASSLNLPVLATHHTLLNDYHNIQYLLKNEYLSKKSVNLIWPILFYPFFKYVWKATAPSPTTCKDLKAHMPLQDIEFISNGIDVSKFGKPKKKEVESFVSLKKPLNKSFIFIGRLAPEKSLEDLLKAFSLFIEKEKDVQLLIVGFGPSEKKLKSLAHSLKLDDYVNFTGAIDNNDIIESKILHDSYCFVSPSMSENQAMTVIEAMCDGLPVICADVPNMTELAPPTVAHYFEGGNVQALADCMLSFYKDKEDRDKKAEATKEVLESFDGMHVAKQFENSYKELLKKKENGFKTPYKIR